MRLSITVTNVNVELLSRVVLHDIYCLIHEGTNYECSQCDYGATWKDILTRHIQSDRLTIIELYSHK